MKAKIFYITVLSGAIVFNFLLVISLNPYIDVPDHADSASYQLTHDSLPGEKEVFLSAVIPCFVFLFSFSESPLLPFRVSAVSAGTRDPPPSL
jgi:hypothetical protein